MTKKPAMTSREFGRLLDERGVEGLLEDPRFGSLTASDFERFGKEAEARMQRSGEASEAAVATLALMREHNVRVAGELKNLGIEIPAEQWARRMLRLYNEGELDDEDLDELGIAIDDDGAILLSLGPGNPITFLP